MASYLFDRKFSIVHSFPNKIMSRKVFTVSIKEEYGSDLEQSYLRQIQFPSFITSLLKCIARDTFPIPEAPFANTSSKYEDDNALSYTESNVLCSLLRPHSFCGEMNVYNLSC